MSAKEMFEELNYTLEEENEDIILYKMKWEISSTCCVLFDLESKYVDCFVTSDSPFETPKSLLIDIPLLKAIYKQEEEFGWLE